MLSQGIQSSGNLQHRFDWFGSILLMCLENGGKSGFGKGSYKLPGDHALTLITIQCSAKIALVSAKIVICVSYS